MNRIENAWNWMTGFLACDPLSPSCVLDWDAISAVATALAVAVALLAIRTENRHRNLERTRADQIRNEELQAARQRDVDDQERLEQARASKARRLAMIFDRELTEAARELLPAIKLTERLTPHNQGQYREIYAEPMRQNVFKMHERFVDQLEVFPDKMAMAIVNNMTNWSSNTLSGGLRMLPGIDLVYLQPKFLAELNELLEVVGETKDELQKYFADMPGIKVFTVEEVQAMNAQKAEVQAKKLAEKAARRTDARS